MLCRGIAQRELFKRRVAEFEAEDAKRRMQVNFMHVHFTPTHAVQQGAVKAECEPGRFLLVHSCILLPLLLPLQEQTTGSAGPPDMGAFVQQLSDHYKGDKGGGS